MPNPRIWNRRLHRWGAIAVALPFLLMLATGLLLQVKKQVHWVQPPEQRGRAMATVPALSMTDILSRAREVPEAGIRSWADIDWLDVRPSKNILKVVSLTRWEIHLELATGEVNPGPAHRCLPKAAPSMRPEIAPIDAAGRPARHDPSDVIDHLDPAQVAPPVERRGQPRVHDRHGFLTRHHPLA